MFLQELLEGSDDDHDRCKHSNGEQSDCDWNQGPLEESTTFGCLCRNALVDDVYKSSPPANCDLLLTIINKVDLFDVMVRVEGMLNKHPRNNSCGVISDLFENQFRDFYSPI